MTSNDFAYVTHQFFHEFLAGTRDLSANTIAAYEVTFGMLLKYANDVKGIAEDRFSLCDLDEDLVFGFVSWLKDSCHSSPATRKQRLAALHAFARFLIPRHPARILEWQKILEVRVRCPLHAEVGHLQQAAMTKLLSMPDLHELDGLRDVAMLGLMYDGALRVQELCDVRVADVRIEKPGIVRVTGKGRKTKTVDLLDPTTNAIAAYVKAARKRPDDYLFTNHQHGKFTRAGIAYVLRKYARLARAEMPEFPERVHPHMLRHSKAMHLMNSGVNIIYIRDHLRHTQLATTQIYAKADASKKRKVLEENGLNLLPEGANPNWHEDKSLMSELRAACRSS